MSRSAALPLRTVLPVLLAGLLAVGLLASGAVGLTMLERTLVDQVDQRLADDAPRLVERYTGGLPEPGDRLDEGALPSQHHLVVLAPDGRTVATVSTEAADGAPAIPALSVAEVVERRGDPFTVADADGSGRWRVLARVAVAPSGRTVGSVVVGLPMGGEDATLARMRGVLLGLGIVSLAVLSVAGWWAVRRALGPLREIETTAAAIAAGDLTRRVPDLPPTTEVGRVAHALNAMLARLEHGFAAQAASQERMRRFVADASHELRTPLAAVRGYAELHRMGALPDDEAVATTFRRVEDAAERMGRLVQDLLQLARLDEDRTSRREPVDLAVLVGDAAADLHALDPSRAVVVEPLHPGGSASGTVLGDEDELRQVLANLVGNVARHTPAGTPAEIRLGKRGEDDVVLEVRDHGPGIPAEHVERVFERFHRVDPSRTRDSGGTGLGLAIVDAVVRAHGGQVRALPTDGGGTTIRVTLPAVPSASVPDPTTTRTAGPWRQPPGLP